VTIACPESTNAVLEVKCTEAMTAPVPETAAHGFASGAEKPILDLIEGRDAVAVGPGIGRGDEALDLVRRIAGKIERPLVLDADGLLAFADAAALLRARTAPTVMTPHPGEAAALLACSPAEINRDRLTAARTLAQETGAVVVLKGAATVTAEPGGRCAVNASGGPILATGGTGDVLTRGRCAGSLSPRRGRRSPGGLLRLFGCTGGRARCRDSCGDDVAAGGTDGDGLSAGSGWI
jgi:NAD(P)H-hydrate epimerase